MWCRSQATPPLADGLEGRPPIPPSEIHEGRSQWRGRVDQPVDERLDDGRVGVATEHPVHRALQQRALGDHGDVVRHHPRGPAASAGITNWFSTAVGARHCSGSL
jgi:hypothetical protein